jgi:uncharacterized membrane protein
MAEDQLPAKPEAPPRDGSDVSADLPYELQSKLFEQLATMGVAGAGLVITLKGSILSEASALIWMGAVEFGLAALVALSAQMGLIEGLMARKVSRRQNQIMTILAVVLIGMGVGTLGTSVLLEGKPAKAAAAKSEA